jgi:centrosomal CEP192-like protein/HYDIN/CFA65/VesB family protein
VGCGSANYEGMTRSASAQAVLRNSGDLLDPPQNEGALTAHAIGATDSAPGADLKFSSPSRGNRDQKQAGTRAVDGEAALAVRSVSSLKLRKQVLLQSLSCANQSMTGTGTTACTVRLSSGAPNSGMTIALSSNNPAVLVPASVTIPAGASSASFAATIAAVTSTQTAGITASANGSARSFSIQLNVAAPALTISSTNVSFGSVAVGQTATSTVTLSSTGNAPLTISSISVAGSLFNATGLAVPLTLNPGQSAVLSLQFYSDHTSSFTGIVTISSNSAQGPGTIHMTASGVPSVRNLTCNTTSYSASGTDSCVVTVYGAAPSTGFSVALASNNSSVRVPASVTVPSGAMSTSFLANVNAVSTSQTATLTATAGGITKSFLVQLAPGNSSLTANASSVPFGSVLINSPAEQAITLTSTGSSPVTISSISITGVGFTGSGMMVPMTLNPGQTAVLNVQFTPTAPGSFSGQISIGSNSNGGNISIGVNGVGYGHKIQLNWNAPSSSAVVGYNIYRVVSGSTGYQKVNSAAVSTTTYTDPNVLCGSSYVYYVTSVDSSGLESSPSNTTTVAIPTS